MRQILSLSLLSLTLLVSAHAGVTVQLSDGTVYDEAEIRSVDGNSVLLTHSGGIARVPLGELDREIRQELGMKPTAATAKSDFELGVAELENSLASLRDAYRGKLQALEKEARTQGDIDSVIEIRKEIASLPDLVPESEIENEKLRKARSDFASALETRQAELAESLGEILVEYRKTLEDVAKDLESSGNQLEAAELRLTINEIASMANDPAEALVFLDIIPSPDGEREKDLIAPRPSLGRIILLPITEAAKNAAAPKTFAAVAASDRSDIVHIGQTNFPNVAAISADGSLVCWTQTELPVEIVPGANEKCLQPSGLPVVALDRDGTLNSSSSTKPGFLSEIAEQKDVSDMAATFGLLALVMEDGSVSTIGPRADHDHAVLLREMTGVKAVGFSGLSFVTILKTDGTVVKMRNGEAREMGGVGPIDKLRSDGIGETEGGSLVNLGANPPSFLQEVGPKPIKIYRQNNFFCGIGEDGTFHCHLRDGNGNITPQEAVERALKGAHGFAPIQGPNGAIWIAALLPSREIQRSGLWDVEDLVAARP